MSNGRNHQFLNSYLKSSNYSVAEVSSSGSGSVDAGHAHVLEPNHLWKSVRASQPNNQLSTPLYCENNLFKHSAQCHRHRLHTQELGVELLRNQQREHNENV